MAAVAQGADGDFYKGLIQLAGAFVHLQKNRLRPSGALLKLAKNNLSKFAPDFEYLNIIEVIVLIDATMSTLENSEFSQNPLKSGAP